MVKSEVGREEIGFLTADYDSQHLFQSRTRNNSKRRRRSSESLVVNCGLSWSVNMILHGVSIAFVSFILYKAIPGYFFFSLHPICMTIAYGLLMLEGVLFFSSQPLVNATKKSTKITWHWIFQALVISLCAVGFTVVYYNKNRLGKNHFTTWHSWIGLLTIIATTIIALGGLFAKYPAVLKRYQRPIILKSVHAFAGCLTFALGCGSLLSGLNSNYFIKLTKDSMPIWQLAYGAPVFMAIAVLFQVLKSFLPRLRSK